MLVSDLVQKLLSLPQHLSVTISDGFKHNFYDGDYSVEVYEASEGVFKVDIGLGGTDEGCKNV